MDNDIAIGGVIGLIIASSLYVWNSNEFTKEQKIFLLIAMIFAPVQWIGILVIKYYNNHKFESTPERKIEKKLDSTISNLTELKDKGILTDEEYKTKVQKIETEKEEQNLKNSLEYRQLKSLFEGGILTKEEFENKIQLLQNVSEKEVETKEISKILDSVNKTYINSTEKVEEKNTNFTALYVIIAVCILSIGGIITYSNSEPNNLEDTYVPPAIDTTVVYNTNSYNSNYQEAQKEEEKIFVYGTVDYKYFEPEYSESSSYPALKKEGKTCSPVFEIKKEELAKFKQRFYSSVDVQHYNHSNSSVEYGYFTYPETVEVLTFVTMDEANEYQMNNCDKTLSTFFYF